MTRNRLEGTIPSSLGNLPRLGEIEIEMKSFERDYPLYPVILTIFSVTWK
jgi:hypothetical protein